MLCFLNFCAASEPLVTAFSTASSTVTMPITFQTLKDKIGLREASASMGALVGSNFNAVQDSQMVFGDRWLIMRSPVQVDTTQRFVMLQSQ